jgi:hypothetical protein
MPDLGCPSALQEQLWQQVHLLHSVQTAPFEAIVSDYTSCLQRKRDLEVRLCTLNRLYTMHGPTLPLSLSSYTFLAARPLADVVEQHTYVHGSLGCISKRKQLFNINLPSYIAAHFPTPPPAQLATPAQHMPGQHKLQQPPN